MSAINDFVGLPFKEKGRDRDGCDCWGLLRLYYRERKGVELPSYDEYDTVSDSKTIAALIDHYKVDWQPVDIPERDDAVLLRVNGDDMHVGVCVGDSRFLHIQVGHLSTIERLDALKWAPRIQGYYRHV